MNKVYLIANNKFLYSKHFSCIKSTDIVCFCNHALHDSERFNTNKKFLFLKFHYEKIPSYKISFGNRYKKTFFILSLKIRNLSQNQKIQSLFRNFKDNKNICKISNVINLNEYSTKKPQPTTGFVAFHKLKKKFPNKEIILIGFDGLNEQNNQFWHKHDYDFEQNYYKINNIKNISAL
jgi:hypothetical protein